MRVPYQEVYRPSDLAGWRVADYLKDIATRLYSLFYAVRNVWLVGDHLATPIWVVYSLLSVAYGYLYRWVENYAIFMNWVHSVRMALMELREVAQDIVDFNRLITDPVGWVRDRLRYAFHDAVTFFNNPAQWVKGLLYYVLPQVSLLINAPWEWIKSYLQYIIADASELLSNPGGWVVERLRRYVWWFGVFLTQPARWVLERLTDSSPEIRSLLQNPRLWVEQQLRSYNPQVVDFLRDPSGWVMEQMFYQLEQGYIRYNRRILTLGERILRYLFEGR